VQDMMFCSYRFLHSKVFVLLHFRRRRGVNRVNSVAGVKKRICLLYNNNLNFPICKELHKSENAAAERQSCRSLVFRNMTGAILPVKSSL
jgi:hypothetical protein